MLLYDVAVVVCVLVPSDLVYLDRSKKLGLQSARVRRSKEKKKDRRVVYLL